MTRPRGSRAADSTLEASRALLAVVARSLAPALERVTLPQYRVLVVLATDGPQRVGALAARLGANASTFSRTLDRMVDGGWVERGTSSESRREVIVTPTDAGTRLVEDALASRRAEIDRVLAALAPAERETLDASFRAFAVAAPDPAPQELLGLGL